MEFVVEFYEEENGESPVERFLDDLKRDQPRLYNLTLAGLKKLENSHNHGEPLTKSIGDDLYEARIGDKNIARILWFYAVNRRIVLLHGFCKKTNRIPPKHRRIALYRKADYLRREEERKGVNI